MAPVVLSPHLDDAVLSCWHLLDRREPATVVNVFTALPPASTPVAWWDRLTGATDSAARMLERQAEDAEARAQTAVRARALGLLDHQYRSGAPPRAEVLAAIAGAVAPGAPLVAPAAMDGHGDHVLVRDAALALAADGHALALYADLPHAVGRGWPAWVTGPAEEPGADVDAAWERALRRSGLVVERLVPHVRPLDAAARARKLAVLGAYRTQRPALDAMAFAPLDDPRTLAFEVTWDVPPSARGGPDEPGGEALVADARRDPRNDRV